MQMEQWIDFCYKFTIRFRDTDSYRIVHHSNYYCYFEEARYDFARKVLSLHDDDGGITGFKFPVLESSCKYKKALTYEDNHFYVDLEFRVLNDNKLEFLYEIRHEGENRVYASGRTLHAVLDGNDRLCMVIPQTLLNRMRGEKKG